MTRIIHLSDIHLTAPNLEWKLEDWFNKRFTSWFNFRVLGRRYRFKNAEVMLSVFMAEVGKNPPDHVIFSGDATALGFESEFRKAAEVLGVGHNPGFPGLAVPGNHDYCTRSAAASGLFETIFAPWQQGVRVDEAVYPFAQHVGPVWLIALNTSTGNRWTWDAGGSAGPEQLHRLRVLFTKLDPAPKILVTHFPVCLANGKPERLTHGLKDLEATVAAACEGKISLWLHGHRHGFYFHEKTQFTPFPVLCVGSATQTGYGTYAEYRFSENNQLDVQIRKFDPEQNTFLTWKTFVVSL